MKIAPGDKVIIVSDGIIEQFNIAAGAALREQFEVNGLRRSMETESPDMVADLFNAVIAHAGTNQLSDDATAVLVKWG